MLTNEYVDCDQCNKTKDVRDCGQPFPSKRIICKDCYDEIMAWKEKNFPDHT